MRFPGGHAPAALACGRLGRPDGSVNVFPVEVKRGEAEHIGAECADVRSLELLEDLVAGMAVEIATAVTRWK